MRPKCVVARASLTIYTYQTGDIMHIKIFGLDIVIISGIETANTLMSQASYSDRPILTMVGKLWVLLLLDLYLTPV
jgi:hypothetical protein